MRRPVAHHLDLDLRLPRYYFLCLSSLRSFFLCFLILLVLYFLLFLCPLSISLVFLFLLRFFFLSPFPFASLIASPLLPFCFSSLNDIRCPVGLMLGGPDLDLELFHLLPPILGEVMSMSSLSPS